MAHGKSLELADIKREQKIKKVLAYHGYSFLTKEPVERDRSLSGKARIKARKLKNKVI